MRRYRTAPNLTTIWVLISVNLIVYLFTLADSSLINSLGLQPSSLDDRPWTMVTNLFVHAGFGHILFNMLALLFFGGFTSRLMGEWNFLAVYFAGGILGNILYTIMAPSHAVAVGASGAIFALGGALVALAPKVKVIVFPVPAPLPLWIAVIGGFFILMIIPNVAWQAHLRNVFYKLNVGSRTEAVIVGLRNGLLAIEDIAGS